MADDTRCAFWYMRYGSPSFRLCDDEQEAARSAAYMTDQETGAVSGVQFADGRLVRVREWTAYHEVQAERRARERRADAARLGNPRPTRKVTDPFSGGEVDADEEAPEWVGRLPRD